MHESELPRIEPPAVCSFCGKRKNEVAKFIEISPAANICCECVYLCQIIVVETRKFQAAPVAPTRTETTNGVDGSSESHSLHVVPRCAFCGKRHDEVAKLIAGPNVNICDSCVSTFDREMQDAICRGELDSSQYEILSPRSAHTRPPGAVIEIRFHVKADRVAEFLASNALHELRANLAKLAPAIKGSGVELYSDSSGESGESFRLHIVVDSVSDESLNLLRSSLDDTSNVSIKPLQSFVTEAPRIQASR